MTQSRMSWKWFYIVISLASIIDFIDHISRKNVFYKNFGDWFLFTLSCTLTIIVFTSLINAVLFRLFKKENIFLQSLSIICGFTFHIYVAGQFFNMVFFPQAILNFHWNMIAVAVALVTFYVVRLIVYFVNKRLTTQG